MKYSDFSNVASETTMADWANHSDVLYFGDISEILSGQMPNKVSGSTDYIAVTGSAGSYFFKCPNTVSYIAADTDFIWTRTDGTMKSGVSENELKNYDFARTLIRYDDASPYTITHIMILSDDLSGDDKNNAVRDFKLSVWWDDTYNSNGHRKKNKGFGKKTHTPKTAIDSASSALFLRQDALTVQSDRRKENIDDTIKLLKDNGLFETKLDKLVVYKSNGDGVRMLNWITDTANSSAVSNGGTFTQTDDIGCSSDGVKSYIRTNYNPATFGGLFTKDDATYGQKISGVLSTGTVGSGSFDGTNGVTIQKSSGVRYLRLNDGAGATTQLIRIGFVGINRSASNEKYFYRSSSLGAKITINSVAIPNAEMYSLAINNSGTPSSFHANTTILELEWIGKSMTSDEFNIFCNIFYKYFENIQTGM